jgi:peptidoglycan/xylan/chitin deacetylase (PgdA/CDA1 family)
VWNAELIRCAQLPTTLPTLDELIGMEDVTAYNVADRLLAMTKMPPAQGHVFTLHAELEGMLLAPALDRLLGGWKAQGYEITSMRRFYESMQPMALPRHEVGPGSVTGRSGTLLMQGREFLGEVDLAA